MTATASPLRDPVVERLTDEEHRVLASSRLRALSDRLAGSPFHVAQLASAGLAPADLTSVDALVDVPLCGKDDLRRSQERTPPFGDHLAVDPREVRRIFQTSGTSGAPVVIALTAGDLDRWTTIGLRSYWAAGLRPEHRVLTTFGAGPFVAGHSHRVLDAIGCCTVPVAPADTARVVGALAAGLADVLLCTPTFAVHLLDRLRSDGVDASSSASGAS